MSVSISRSMNKTEFDADGQQLAEFSVTFHDTDFGWAWGGMRAYNQEHVRASLVPGTFTTDAPLEHLDVWEHGAHFDYDRDAIEIGKTYTFSVTIQIETDLPVKYKPHFSTNYGLHHQQATASGYTAEIPADMLPGGVTSATVSTNVSNYWHLERYDDVKLELWEVVELVGPQAKFYLRKSSAVWTENDSIASDTFASVRYHLSIQNEDDTSDTILGNLGFSVQADNITDVQHEEYAVWDETSATWTFPAEYILYERWEEGDVGLWTGFGTDHTEKLNIGLNRSQDKTEFDAAGYQQAEFEVTFEDTDFIESFGGIWVPGDEGIEVSIVPDTFTHDAPLVDFREEGGGIWFDFDKEQLVLGKTYNFSVLIKVELTDIVPPVVFKLGFYVVKLLDEAHGSGEGYQVEMPGEMLPEHVSNASATTDVANSWTLRQTNYRWGVLGEVLELVGPHTGQVDLPGRADDSGVTITVEGTDISIISTADGSFTLTGVPAGKQTLIFSKELFLVRKLTVDVPAIGILELSDPVTLKPGDANGDNEVNIQDLTLLASAYRSVEGEDEHYNAATDFNADGKVNIQDLTLLAGSYRQVGDK